MALFQIQSIERIMKIGSLSKYLNPIINHITLICFSGITFVFFLQVGMK